MPPGRWRHSNIMMVPISVIPAESPQGAPQVSSIFRRTAGTEPEGSPERMILSTFPSFRRSMPSSRATCARRST